MVNFRTFFCFILLQEILGKSCTDFCFCRYGGGPTLARKVISSGPSQTELAVEVYPLRLQLLVMPKGGTSAIRISKKVRREALS